MNNHSFALKPIPLLVILAGISSNSYAQLEEVIVTAQKRAQSLQDIGITASAFSGDRLNEAGVTDVVDVAALATNVQVNYGLGNNFFNIRGLGLNEFVANLDSPVAVHVDEVYQSKGFMTGMTLFDIERVEVLKGPQGDLFGRNTTGGAVNFFTRRPGEEFGGFAKLTYGDYETLNVEAAVDLPISERVHARLSGYFTDQGEGYYSNTTTGSDEGFVNEMALRAQVSWSFDRSDLLFSAHYGKDDSELHPYEGLGINTAAGDFCPEYLNGSVRGNTPDCLRGLDLAVNPNADLDNPAPHLQPGENDPFTVQGNLSFEVENESWGGYLRYEREFDTFDLTSITAYEDFDQNQREDSDGSPIDSVQVYWYTEFEQFTQEVRLVSDESAAYSWIVGAFYEHDELYNGDFLTAFDIPGGGLNFLNNYSQYEQTVDALAFFGHVEYQITDKIRLVNGVRWSWEETELDGGTFAGTGLTDIGGEERPSSALTPIATSEATENGGTRRDENVSYKFGVNYTPSDNALVYGSITTGFRSGGYSVAFAASQSELTNLEPETITSYEMGFKSEWNNTLQINGAVFRYDYQDAHIDVDADGAPVPITVNAGDVEIMGAELDVQWAPIENLNLSAGVGWVDSEIEADLTINTGIGPQNLSGNRTAFSPEWTFTGQARYQMDLSDGLRAVASTDISWRDEAYLEANNQPSNLRDDYWLVNARLALESSDGDWSIAAWGKNLTDEAYQVYLNDLPAFGWLLNGYAAPRTYGVTVAFNF
ncbi:MAG: iron complex outermembrane receptor protein [Halioglobus sp.]|jgi:iron complex outermembrane receptor protein